MVCEFCGQISFQVGELKELIIQLADRFDRQEAYIQRIANKLESGSGSDDSETSSTGLQSAAVNGGGGGQLNGDSSPAPSTVLSSSTPSAVKSARLSRLPSGGNSPQSIPSATPTQHFFAQHASASSLAGRKRKQNVPKRTDEQHAATPPPTNSRPPSHHSFNSGPLSASPFPAASSTTAAMSHFLQSQSEKMSVTPTSHGLTNGNASSTLSQHLADQKMSSEHLSAMAAATFANQANNFGSFLGALASHDASMRKFPSGLKPGSVKAECSDEMEAKIRSGTGSFKSSPADSPSIDLDSLTTPDFTKQRFPPLGPKPSINNNNISNKINGTKDIPIHTAPMSNGVGARGSSNGEGEVNGGSRDGQHTPDELDAAEQLQLEEDGTMPRDHDRIGQEMDTYYNEMNGNSGTDSNNNISGPGLDSATSQMEDLKQQGLLNGQQAAAAAVLSLQSIFGTNPDQSVFGNQTEAWSNLMDMNSANSIDDKSGSQFQQGGPGASGKKPKQSRKLTSAGGEKGSYKCKECGATYNWASGLSRHYRMTHRQGTYLRPGGYAVSKPFGPHFGARGCKATAAKMALGLPKAPVGRPPNHQSTGGLSAPGTLAKTGREQLADILRQRSLMLNASANGNSGAANTPHQQLLAAAASGALGVDLFGGGGGHLLSHLQNQRGAFGDGSVSSEAGANDEDEEYDEDEEEEQYDDGDEDENDAGAHHGMDADSHEEQELFDPPDIHETASGCGASGSDEGVNTPVNGDLAADDANNCA